MKHRVSITVDEDLIFKIREVLRSKSFKNKSQFFEKAAKDMIRRNRND